MEKLAMFASGTPQRGFFISAKVSAYRVPVIWRPKNICISASFLISGPLLRLTAGQVEERLQVALCQTCIFLEELRYRHTVNCECQAQQSTQAQSLHASSCLRLVEEKLLYMLQAGGAEWLPAVTEEALLLWITEEVWLWSHHAYILPHPNCGLWGKSSWEKSH